MRFKIPIVVTVEKTKQNFLDLTLWIHRLVNFYQTTKYHTSGDGALYGWSYDFIYKI